MFSQASILSVNPPVVHGSELLLSWTSSAAAGTVYQVYVDGRLSYAGLGTRCAVPLPPAVAHIDIGTVGPGERQVNFASSLPPRYQRHANLSWLGGTYLSANLAGFNIYGESSPGAGINFSAAVAQVPAYTAGIVTDGFGSGGFGQGGFGQAAGWYSWSSPPLTGGTWHWAVQPFDAAGNEGPAQTIAVTIQAPPGPPAPFPNGQRLEYVYHSSTRQAVLSWNPSA